MDDGSAWHSQATGLTVIGGVKVWSKENGDGSGMVGTQSKIHRLVK